MSKKRMHRKHSFLKGVIERRDKAGIGCQGKVSLANMLEFALLQQVMCRPIVPVRCTECGMIHVTDDERYVAVELGQAGGHANTGMTQVESTTRRSNAKSRQGAQSGLVGMNITFIGVWCREDKAKVMVEWESEAGVLAYLHFDKCPEEVQKLAGPVVEGMLDGQWLLPVKDQHRIAGATANG